MNEGIFTFGFVMIGWVFSTCVHEFSHAYVAYMGGDHSVKDKGYLSLNPLAYADPVYSVVIPVAILLMGGIALPGAAVYIRTSALRGRGWRAAVSIAGPASNAVLALIAVAVLRFVPPEESMLRSALALLIHLEVVAVALCMIPVPPLDGYGVIEPFLTPAFRNEIAPMHRWGMWAVILTLFYIAPVSARFWAGIQHATNALGVDPALIREAWGNFHFWKGR